MPKHHWDVPPLELLLAFESAARLLSFTKAGEELFLTQSAVSRQIQALEESIGHALFERRTRALLLTDNGQMLFRVAQEVLDQVQDAVARMRSQTSTRTVTITSTPGFASVWLIPRLAHFTKVHPDIDVRISASNDYVNLERSGIDIAIRYALVESMKGARQFMGEEVMPVCSPSLAADPERPLREPADLRRHVLLHLNDERAAWLDWNLWTHALGLAEFKPAGALYFSSYDQVVQAANSGQGVALGRFPLLAKLVRKGRLVAPLGQAVSSSRAYYLVRSARTAASPEVGAFVEWLDEEVRQDAEAEAQAAASAPGTSRHASRQKPPAPRASRRSP